MLVDLVDLELFLSHCFIRFVVKFYMPDPSQLEEEYTRYLAALQVIIGVYIYFLSGEWIKSWESRF